MDEELIKLLCLWYVKSMKNVYYEDFIKFINLVFSNANYVLDFASYLKYTKTTMLLKRFNQNSNFKEFINMFRTAIIAIKEIIGDEFYDIQNNLLEELKVQYAADALHSVYEEIIDEIIENRKDRI